MDELVEKLNTALMSAFPGMAGGVTRPQQNLGKAYSRRRHQKRVLRPRKNLENAYFSSPPRLGGIIAWKGFEGKSQVERQQALWKVLESSITADELAASGMILTFTPDELAAARAT